MGLASRAATPLLRSGLGIAVLWTLAALVATPAAAQEAGGGDEAPAGDSDEGFQSSLDERRLEQARELFLEGSQAADEARWADAADLFERSYGLSGVPSALFNRAVALRSLGRHREARNAFDRLLENHPDLDAQTKAAATSLRDESAARVAVLQLVGLERVRHRLSLDGEERTDEGERPIDLETDEGTHTVVVRRDGYVPFVWEGAVEAGATERVRVALEPEGRTGPVPEESSSIFASGWFWLAVGVVVAGTGAAVGYVLWQDAQLEGQSDTVVEL